MTLRAATDGDIPALHTLMASAIAQLQAGFLSPAEIVASRAVMGLDTQLIHDGTYVVAVEDHAIVACGGWSHRATLYGGDHSASLRDAASLDPEVDAARIRAMYTHPSHVRRGLGRRILAACEAGAAAAGFRRAEMMATLAGEPLYRRCGYIEIARVRSAEFDGVCVPLIRMGKEL